MPRPVFDLAGKKLPPNPLRAALMRQLAKLEGKPTFLRDVRLEAELPLVTCATTRDPFFDKDILSNWFLGLAARMLSGDEALDLPMYRAISMDSLAAVATSGIDVTPSDAVIWATDCLDKALEYGGDSTKAVLVLDAKALARSFTIVPSGASPSLIEEVEKRIGPDFLAQPDGSRYYSRLPTDDRRRDTPYEREYGWYIPGAPFSALAGIVFFKVEA